MTISSAAKLGHSTIYIFAAYSWTKPNQTEWNDRPKIVGIIQILLGLKLIFVPLRPHAFDEKARKTKYFECVAFSQWEMKIEIETETQ